MTNTLKPPWRLNSPLAFLSNRKSTLHRTVPPARSIGVVIFAVFGALFAGLLAAQFPWWFVVGLFVSPLVLLAAARYPVFGLVLALFFVFNVIPERLVPRIPFGGGEWKVYDLLLIYLAFVMLFRLAIRKLPITAALGPSFWPFVYVVSCVAISTIYGRVFLGHQFAISEARNQIVWLLIPLMAIYVDSPKRFQLLLRATLFAAIVISIYLVTQSVFNIDIMGNRVESLDNRGNQDVIRSTAGGGVYLIAFATMYFLGMGISRRIPLLLVFMSVLVLVAGLAVTFGRGVWVATACGLLLASVLNRGFIGGIKTSIVGGVILMLFLAGTVVVKPRVAEALVDRVTGLATEFERGASFGDRLTENADAIKAIRNHPLLGVGMGGEYVVTVRTFDVDGRYIHNSYLFFPLKMGMIAAAVPFTFMLFFIGIYRGWFAKLSVQSRTVPAAIAGAFFVPMVTSVTQPEWAAPQGIAAISLLFMLAWLYRRLNIASTSESLEGAAKPHVQASRPGRTATHASTIASNAHAHRPTK